MSSKRNNPKNSGQEADKSPENKASKAIDESQVTLSFGQEEEADPITEQEFQQRAEAEMKRRAQEGQRFREEMEAQKMVEQEKQERKEARAREKAAEEQKLQKEAEAQRKVDYLKLRGEVEENQRLKEESDTKRKTEEKIGLKEEAEAKKRDEKKQFIKEGPEAKKSAEEEIKEREEAQAKNRAEAEKRKKDNAEVKRIIQEEQSRKEEAETKRKTQEENRIMKSEAAIKLRDEEWRKFKEEADAKGNSESAYPLEYATEPNESFKEMPQTKNKNPKRKVLVVLLIGAIAIAGIWIFSVFNEGTKKQTSLLPKEEATKIDDATVTPEPESDAANQEASFTNLKVGDIFEGGIIFTIVPSGKTGKVAYSKDTGPMPWKNAMNIHEQLGEGWRLPNMDELSIMYRNIGQGANNSGQFSDELYWSATPYDAHQARLLRFSDGNTSFHYNNSVSNRKFLVRAVRDFSR